MRAIAVHSDRSYQLNETIFYLENFVACEPSNLIHKRRISNRLGSYPSWTIQAHTLAKNEKPITISLEVRHFIDPRKSYPVVFSDEIVLSPAESLDYTLELPFDGNSVIESTVSVDVEINDKVYFEKLSMKQLKGKSESRIIKNVQPSNEDLTSTTSTCM
jgi:hypothetical protein